MILFLASITRSWPKSPRQVLDRAAAGAADNNDVILVVDQ
jgi:hypothetical protein